jgi:predicted transcriptional regulator
MRENRKHTTRVSSDEARHLKDETDYARLDAMTDDDIAQAVADDPDAPPLDIDWSSARLSLPPGKDIVTLRLDRDVLDWFRAQGKGYQTRINLALRVFYEASGRGSNSRVAGVKAKAAHPAVPPKKSITGDYIICLEDGRKFKSLKRHLRTQYNLSPEEYREKWGLPSDYPMVAPAYAKARSALAKQMGRAVAKRRA